MLDERIMILVACLARSGNDTTRKHEFRVVEQALSRICQIAAILPSATLSVPVITSSGSMMRALRMLVIEAMVRRSFFQNTKA